MSSAIQKLKIAAPFMSLWFIGFFGLTFVPVVLSAFYSMCYFDGNELRVWVGFDNYRDLFFRDPIFMASMKNTLYMVVIGLPVSLGFCLGIALLLNSLSGKSNTLRSIIYVPSMMPVVGVSILWVWLLNTRSGLLNQMLGTIGIDPIGWLSDPVWAKPALIIMGLWGAGTTILIYLAALQQVPRALYEAAQIDGAGIIRSFFYVTIPGISPTILFTVVTGVIGYFQYFSQAYIMTNGGPQDSTMFYSLHLFNEAYLNWRMGYASAMAWILLLITLACVALVGYSSKRWVHYQ